ncbi:hypothetical protein K502DRAFT_345925 [Neoconidiobolus thromboides FSU 785]|nr:hypothetical protein K502DRAFT_345925 [Neoconidiobolus thromboides FSU 785]
MDRKGSGSKNQIGVKKEREETLMQQRSSSTLSSNSIKKIKLNNNENNIKDKTVQLKFEKKDNGLKKEEKVPKQQQQANENSFITNEEEELKTKLLYIQSEYLNLLTEKNFQKQREGLKIQYGNESNRLRELQLESLSLENEIEIKKEEEKGNDVLKEMKQFTTFNQLNYKNYLPYYQQLATNFNPISNKLVIKNCKFDKATFVNQIEQWDQDINKNQLKFEKQTKLQKTIQFQSELIDLINQEKSLLTSIQTYSTKLYHSKSTTKIHQNQSELDILLKK